jgi:hypothetical protein
LVLAPLFKGAGTSSEGQLLGVGASKFAAGRTTNSETLVVAPFVKGAGTSSEGRLLGVDAVVYPVKQQQPTQEIVCWLPFSKEPAPHLEVNTWELVPVD